LYRGNTPGKTELAAVFVLWLITFLSENRFAWFCLDSRTRQSGRVMSPQRFAVLAVLCATLVPNGWIVAELADLGWRSTENDEVRIVVDTPRPTAIAKASFERLPVQKVINAAFSELAQMPPPASVVSVSTPDLIRTDVGTALPPVQLPEIDSVLAGLPDPQEVLAPTAIASVEISDPGQGDVEASPPSPDATEAASANAEPPDAPKMTKPPVRLVSLFRPDSSDEDLKPIARVTETPNECLVVEICIDDYLWAFYERTPKVDTNKLKERVKATIRKRGKTRIVMKTLTKYVVADFAWKDPIAAQKAGMSLKDYVIGGMDRGFKLKLYHALRAMDDAGLMPGITSAFRDDYRQAIASGNKAASDSSFHGGSRRGGYGHGLAADLVSVKGDTRLERFASSVELWKWIDAHEKELGIARPYLNRDPPHVGPIDGQEYAAKRGGARAKLAKLITSRRHSAAAPSRPAVIRSARKAGPVRVGSI
jgi:hypothetical protein